MNYDLSILIPARNEMFLAQTVKNILQNIRGNTQIIVGLDGQWADPGIEDHPRVTIFYSPVSLGQRGMTNQLCRLSNAKYVMKIDAHVAVSEGFDVEMMQAMEKLEASNDPRYNHYTMIPLMRNLHAFDWVCEDGHRRYQSPSGNCTDCGKETQREIVWIGKESPKSTAYRFDKTLHFQYWNEYKKRPEGQGDLTDTLTIQGSCFMLRRQMYWKLDICDEDFGSWGQQGVEVALKTWLSGGRVVCNQKCWYAHMFRTQGGDFGFPYPISGKQVDHARKFSRDLFINNTWPQAIRTFQSVLDQFAPVPEWHDGEPKEVKVDNQPQNLNTIKPKKGVVYYTHNIGNEALLEACRKQLLQGIKAKHIVSVSSDPLENFGTNIVFPQVGVAKFLDMFQKILVGLKNSDADIVFFCEHDVLYHPSHFDFVPPEKDVYYYNTNVWRVREKDGHALWVDDLKQLSGIVAYRETLIKHYEERLSKIYKQGFSMGMGFEPGTHNREERVDSLPSQSYQAKYPNIDIRHDNNATASRWSKEEFRNQKYTQGWKEATLTDIPGWDFSAGLLKPVALQ